MLIKINENFTYRQIYIHERVKYNNLINVNYILKNNSILKKNDLNRLKKDKENLEKKDNRHFSIIYFPIRRILNNSVTTMSVLRYNSNPIVYIHEILSYFKYSDLLKLKNNRKHAIWKIEYQI